MTTDADTPAYHYALIARALREIDSAGPGLGLDDLAARIGLSPGHFQRTFTAWVGVSPKRYQQYLTLDHARQMLSARHSTLETALEAGLSGTGRLHDLFLRWEAMSPGEFALGGAGLTIRWGWFDSPYGPALVMGTDRGICGLGFAAEMGEEATFADLAGRWPAAVYARDEAFLRPWALAAFGSAMTRVMLWPSSLGASAAGVTPLSSNTVGNQSMTVTIWSRAWPAGIFFG